MMQNEGPNQQQGNKRPFSSTGEDNQGGRNPRGDHGGKFQRRSFGDRGSFNNGNRFNRGGPFNKNNNFNRGRNQNFGQGRDNQNFNRGRNNQNFQGRNNQNFRKGGFQNNRFNKSWEGNGNDNAPDFEQNNSVTKHKIFDEENEIEVASNTVTALPKNKKSKNTKQNVEQNEDEASSRESDQEVETSRKKNQKEAKENKEEEVETSSECEEETVTNSNNVQNTQNKDEEDKKSKDKIKANDKSRTVYVGSLPASVTEKKVKKLFEKYGKIECIKFRVTQDEYAAVNIIFEKLEDAEKAEEVNGMMYKNHRLSVFFCRGRRTKDKRTSVFAREIPSGFTLTDIWDAFESTYGPVRDIVLPISKTGHFRPTGYAFIDFQSVDSKELAITDKQITIKGKIIKVAEFQEQEKGRSQ